MRKEKKEKIISGVRMVKDSSVTDEERKEKERNERIEKLEKTVAAQGVMIEELKSRLAALESRVM
jgi:predicted RNase H-like nuclease (RuvC/YqgF family)